MSLHNFLSPPERVHGPDPRILTGGEMFLYKKVDFFPEREYSE